MMPTIVPAYFTIDEEMLLLKKKMFSFRLAVIIILLIVCIRGSACNVSNIFGKISHAVTLSCTRNSSVDDLLWLGPPDLTIFSHDDEINPKLKQYTRLTVTLDSNRGMSDLHISNLSRSDEGLYRCSMTLNNFAHSNDILLRIYRKPNIKAGNTINLEVEIGQVINISTIIDCFPVPSVSWSESAGGKLGIWTVDQRSTGEYLVRSSILVVINSQLGNYTALVRNREGSTEINILLYTNDSYVSSDQQVLCNTSNHIYINCKLYSKKQTDWTNTWDHYRSGVHIRHLQGNVNNSESILTLQHCDFQDEGEYTCTWESSTSKTTATTAVVVYGAPMITRKIITTIDENRQIEVDFYSSTPLISIQSFWNDHLVEQNYSIKHFAVELNCYEKTVTTSGYRVSYQLGFLNVSNSRISCQLRNQYGSSEVTLSVKDVIYLLPDTTGVVNISVGYQTLTSTDLKSNSFTESPYEDHYFETQHIIYIALGGLTVISIVFAISTALKKQSSLSNAEQIRNVEHGRETEQEQIITDVMNNVDNAESPYVEIDTISYQSVQWRTYDLEWVDENNVSSSEQSEEKSSNASNHVYLDLIDQDNKCHSYSQCECNYSMKQ